MSRGEHACAGARAGRRSARKSVPSRGGYRGWCDAREERRIGGGECPILERELEAVLERRRLVQGACDRRRRVWRQRTLLVGRRWCEEISQDHFAQWWNAKVRVRRGVNSVGHIARRGVRGVRVPWVRVDLKISEGHCGHLSGEEAQVVVDYVQVLECM